MKDSSATIKKHANIRIRQHLILSFACATLFAVMILALMIQTNKYPLNMWLLLFFQFLIAYVWSFIVYLSTRRFKKLIRLQEARLSVVFSDENAKHLGNNIYIANDWLIQSGKCAVHRSFIKNMEIYFGWILIEDIDGELHKIMISTKHGSLLTNGSPDDIFNWFKESNA